MDLETSSSDVMSSRRVAPAFSRCVVLPLVLLGAVVQATACGSSDVPLESSEGRFRVLLPGVPEQYEETVRTADGPRVGHFFHLSFVEGNPIAVLLNKFRNRPLSYSVSYVVLESGDSTSDPVKALEDAQKQALEDLAQLESGVAPRVTEQQSVSLDTHPGQEVTVQSERGLFWRVRVYVVDGRSFALWILGNAEQVHGDAAERFFASFTAW